MTEALDNVQLGALLGGLSDWHPGYPPHQYDPPECIFKSVNCLTAAEAMGLAGLAVVAVGGYEGHLGVSVYGFPGRATVTFLLRTWNEAEQSPVCGVTHDDITLAEVIDDVLAKRE